jgi:acyl-CoA dehydrogenase
MSDDLLLETLDRLLADHRPGRGPGAQRAWVPEVWTALEDAGLSRVGVPEALGGAGGELIDALTVARSAARHGIGAPVADTVAIGGWLLGRADLALPGGVTAVAEPDATDVRLVGGSLDGTVRAARWLGVADHLALVAGDAVVLVAASAGTPLAVEEVSGEPHEGRSFSAEPVDAVPVPGIAEALRRRGALVRSAQMVGGLEGALLLAVDHARQREQFGQPIARFQAVQHLLARLAAEVVAAQSALALAVDGQDTPSEAAAVATAKARVGAAATTGARLAHQVVGAIGFTQEHPLGDVTRRLWGWREDYGDEAAWQRRLGATVLDGTGADVWPLLTSLPAVVG